MRTAFIATSYWAFGELLIAMNFAEELKASGNEVLFVIPPSQKEIVRAAGYNYTALIPKSRKFNRIILNEVEQRYRPEVVVLSDFLNYSFAEKHYGLLREDLNLFSGKLAAFDIYNWSLERKCMDTYGFKSSIPEKTDVGDYGEKIIPCPIADSRNTASSGGYCYSLITTFLDTSIKHRKEIRAKYGFDARKKIILVSYAKWQESHISHEKIVKFIDLSAALFDELVRQLSRYYTVLVVGKESDGFKGCGGIHCFDSMPPEKFDELAAACDLYIGKNMTSTSMARIAMSGIICVNIINSIVKREKIEETRFGNLDYSHALNGIYMYKYLMLPVGWYYFLKPLFKDNLYADIICVREQFRMNETMEVIHELLTSKEKQDEFSRKVSELNKINKKLSKPSQIIRSIIDR